MLLFATISSLRTLQQSITHNPNALVSAEVGLYERRLAPLKSLLPTRGYVGYLSDTPHASTYFRKYYATQYALAPLMFVILGDLPPDVPYTPNTDTSLATSFTFVIADVSDRQGLESQAKRLNLTIVDQIDETLFLLRRIDTASKGTQGSNHL